MVLIVFDDTIGDMLGNEKPRLIVTQLFIINLHNKSTIYYWSIKVEN